MADLQLSRVPEDAAALEALAGAAGGRIGLAGLLPRLDRRARPSWAGRLLGRAVATAYRWDGADQRDPQWWPQGVSGAADADDSGLVLGRRLLLTTWYARDLGHGSPGSRLSVLDLDTLRYTHVRLVRARLDEDGAPRADPVRIHAGGLAWRGPHLHLAATTTGVVGCHLEDLLDAPGEGHRFALPVREIHRAAGAQPPFRFSFLSVDRSTPVPGLLAGEYGVAGTPTRWARFDLTPEGTLATDGGGVARATAVTTLGLPRMQGAVAAGDRCYVTASRGPWRPGSVHVGGPGAFRERRWAVPMGPEDLSWWPGTDRLWTVTEHPRRRWVVALRRDRLD